MVMTMYKEPKFYVEIDGVKSGNKVQGTGIRQGCPLSPYLFTLVMTCLFEDVHNTEEGGCGRGAIYKHRVIGAYFDEVLYADDTVCISESVPAMNRLLKQIEIESAKYGMRLNKGKCVALGYGTEGNIHLSGGEHIAQEEEVKYLGCQLDGTGDSAKEVMKRISKTMITMKKLDQFWLSSNCGVKKTNEVYDAVIEAKLLYGMESLQMRSTVKKKLDTFQLKVLRKILRMKTTHVNKSNTNQKVFLSANDKLKMEYHQGNIEREAEGRKKNEEAQKRISGEIERK